MLKTRHGKLKQSRTWGFVSHDINLRSCSGNVEYWCPHLLNLFTKLSHYLFCVRISLGCGRIGQMGFKTFLQAQNSQDWTDGLQEVTFRPWTHGKRKRKGKKACAPCFISKHRNQYKIWETCRVFPHLSSHSWNKSKNSSPEDAGLKSNSCKYLFSF